MNDCIEDLPPEYCHYHDEGCEFSEFCLSCPLPVCIYDEPDGKQKLLRRRRAAEMARLFTKEGKNIRELAQIFNVSNRTVHRTLKTVFGDKDSKNTAAECCCENQTDHSFFYKREMNNTGVQK
jgi:hypothetical protein